MAPQPLIFTDIHLGFPCNLKYLMHCY
ncbi:hypothetical protein IAS62_001611 [Cryptococcus decagattii]|uniref:Uncharacterized protein n=1 Tax=Cryptococcus decagattii TaxID=1859122 RepID=A0ABZ2APA8_9TREE